MSRTTLCTTCLLVLCGGLSVAAVLSLNDLSPPRPNLFVEPPALVAAPLPALVQELNARNAAVRSLSCDNLEVKVWDARGRHRVRGSLYYEKPTNLRLVVRSVVGTEVDIGSNTKAFWYWSRRDPRPGLHWATHEDFGKTRLKTPFSPAFIRATLGVNEFPAENCAVHERPDEIKLSYPQTNAVGDKVQFTAVIDRASKRISGYYVTAQLSAGSGYRPVVSCEIQEWKGSLPARLFYQWHEEGRSMLLTLRSPTANTAIDPATWAMPDYQPKLNMADEQ